MNNELTQTDIDKMQAELDDVHSSVLANEIYIIRNAKQQGSV